KCKLIYITRNENIVCPASPFFFQMELGYGHIFKNPLIRWMVFPGQLNQSLLKRNVNRTLRNNNFVIINILTTRIKSCNHKTKNQQVFHIMWFLGFQRWAFLQLLPST